jgi:hypothetical protein
MNLPVRLSILLALCASTPAFAQQLDLPRPSPNAKITQTVGLTEISVEYSAPGVKGRKIWGELVPYDKLWRAGANAPTKISFSRDVKIGGQTVPAGSYAFYAIPGKSTWTLILNKDLNQAGTGADYKQELDQLRVTAKPQPIRMRERLAYQVLDFDDAHATLALDWEKLRVPMAIQVDTDAQVQGNIAAYENDSWRPLTSAARYQLESKKDYDAGLKLVDKSLQLKEDWLNVWTKAQLLAAKGQYKEAYPLAQRAQELGEKAPVFFFADDVKKALNTWKNK